MAIIGERSFGEEQNMPMKATKKKDKRSDKIKELRAKHLKSADAAAIKGGVTTMKVLDKTSPS